jgi:hypothetical protein
VNAPGEPCACGQWRMPDEVRVTVSVRDPKVLRGAVAEVVVVCPACHREHPQTEPASLDGADKPS